MFSQMLWLQLSENGWGRGSKFQHETLKGPNLYCFRPKYMAYEPKYMFPMFVKKKYIGNALKDVLWVNSCWKTSAISRDKRHLQYKGRQPRFLGCTSASKAEMHAFTLFKILMPVRHKNIYKKFCAQVEGEGFAPTSCGWFVDDRYRGSLTFAEIWGKVRILSVYYRTHFVPKNGTILYLFYGTVGNHNSMHTFCL